MIREITDPKTGITVISEFDKEFKNDKYELLFNTKTGFELLMGINGYDDPFMTELPTMLDVGIMGHCSNNCPFCYQDPRIVEPNMKLDDFKRIIDEVKHHASQVALGGRGNPEDHEDFEEIVKYASENKVTPNYTTAGNNVNHEIVNITKKYVGAVAVSDYDKPFTYSALKIFMDADIKTNIHFVFSSKSFDKAINVLNGIDVWNGQIDLEKLNAIVFLLFKPQGRAKNLIDWIPSKKQLRIFANKIKFPKSKIKIGLDSCLVNCIKEFVEFSPIEEMSIDTCESGRMSVYITPDMKLVPCSFADHNEYGVKLHNNTIENVWNNGRPFKKFREILKEKSNCCPAIL